MKKRTCSMTIQQLGDGSIKILKCSYSSVFQKTICNRLWDAYKGAWLSRQFDLVLGDRRFSLFNVDETNHRNGTKTLRADIDLWIALEKDALTKSTP